MTTERITRKDWEWAAIPKKRRVKVRMSRKAKVPESAVQTGADFLLELHHWPYLRFPDRIFTALKSHPWLTVGEKAYILDAISGWPDAIPFLPLVEFNGVHLCLCPMIENKSDVGQLHGKQRDRARELGYNVCRSPEDIQRVIKTTEFFMELVVRLIREHNAKKEELENGRIQRQG